MNRKKGVIVGIFIGVFIILSIISVSAKWYEVGKQGESFWGKLFAAKPFNVSVSMANSAPQVIKIWNPGTVGPMENNIRTVTINFTAYDSNGAGEIDGAPALFDMNLTSFYNNLAVPTLTGDNYRAGYSCAVIAGEITTYTVNWSCRVDMHYWDVSVPKLWNITARIIDDSGVDAGVNVSNSNAALGLSYLSYSSLAGHIIDRTGLTWSGVTSGTVNSPSNAPINVTNAGNVNITGLAVDNKYIQVTGYNLTGVSTPSNLFYSESFFADDVNTACAAASGYQILNASVAQNITDARFERRPKSDPTSNATIYFCLDQVLPSPIPGDTYVANRSASGNGGAWLIGLYAL